MRVLKRLMDILVSLSALIVLSPIFLVVGILIAIKLGRPVFFVQKRVGKNNKVFNMIKFRTMKDIKDKNGNLLSDKERLTSFGEKLRSLSIDELPELINILKGDMSLVGPRPLLVEYLPLYSKEQLRRHEVLPGLTGWAQINGRNSISWKEKFKLDVWYVENWSFALDIKIFFLTISKVLKKSDINQSEDNTMEKFNGKN
ncbi:sugar transferase [Clostridium chauvoei]|uniref:Sugar transferase n=2 Tax=Clostridium chauvoei TaxID=46867 RepID=A0ABD4RE71_9CLOT|nr:sugar transferase [Clostridium chauvoei]ATD54379.1 sugar transferase [Clostridium chauvoei]ATD57937.1 sugar transferase [Clostridium chauvoei]MBX7279729.1 sugar transferase [Clostridium chauvoei]MBX7282098.1 sugar transferase [Clostridium chauvoei]MBX7284620.1 sugar transferase [Clostridium chauvoei]